MTQAVADSPRTADQFLDPIRPAESFLPLGVVFRERLIVPADGPANLVSGPVDSRGRVVSRRYAPRDPVLQSTDLPQLFGDGPQGRPRLPFKLHQVQLGDAALRPEVGREAHLGQDLARQVKGQALHGPGAEVPTGDDRFGRHRAEFGHETCEGKGRAFALSPY